MYKTLEIERTNGKENDYKETLWVSIHVNSAAWCYIITWELGGGGTWTYTECGDAPEPTDWERVVKSDLINNIIGTQTVIDDAEAFLAGEGAWMTLTEDDFADDQWEVRA